MERLVDYKNFELFNKKLSKDEFKKLRILSVFGLKDQQKSCIYVTNEDQVYGFGDNSNGCLGLGILERSIPVPKQNTTLSGKQLIDISVGFDFCIALTSSGQCWSWGNNGFGQLGGPSGRSSTPRLIEDLSHKRVVQICCGSYHTLALTETGQMYGWGRNSFGQIGDNSTAIRFNPKICCITEKVALISSGKCHSLAVTNAGVVYVWGTNKYGQLGREIKDISFDVWRRPARVNSLTNHVIKKVICGSDHSLLLTSSGDVYGFGRNNCGQVGAGTQTNQCSPVRINGEIEFKDVETSYVYDISIGISIDGKHYVWGLCHNRSVLKPRQVISAPSDLSRRSQTLFDVFINFTNLSITFKTVVVNTSEDNKSLSEPKVEKNDKITRFLIEIKNDSNIDSNDPKLHKLNNLLITDNQTTNNREIIKLSTQPSTQSLSDSLKFESKVFHNCFRQPFNDRLNYTIRFAFGLQYIYGHKSVFSVRNKKFWHKCEEHLKHGIEISFAPSVYNSFYAFIQYLYKNIVDIDGGNVANLLSLAIRFEEKELKQRCSEWFTQRIDLTNVCQLYSYSIENQRKGLRILCQKFIDKNWKQICLTHEFQAMDDLLAKQMLISSLNGTDIKFNT